MLPAAARRYPVAVPAAFLLLSLGTAASFLGGCDAQETITTGPTGESGGDQRSYCEGLLDSLVSMVQPDRLGVSSDPKSAADLMNEWLPRCGAKDAPGAELDSTTTELAKGVLGQERLAELSGPRFVARDAAHLRNAILFKQAGEFAVSSAADDVDRVTQLFHYAMRNVALASSGDNARIPLSPYEIMLFGRGSAEDRAWIFAELLRQLRIDAIIVRPQVAEEPESQESGAGDRWLVGVLLEDEVYLFDPRLGWPIPSPADDGKTPLVRKPARLAEVVDNPELLSRIDVDDEHKYPLRTEDLKAVRVELIAHDQYWATRMSQLEASLAGERAVTLYDGLGSGRAGPGLVERVAAAGGSFWDRDDISVWPHPQQSVDRHAQLEEGGDQQLLVRHFPFQAPVPVTANVEEQKVEVGRPRRQQLETRIAQLEGRYEDAIKSYQLIRISGSFHPQLPVPPELRLMNARAADDAMYWVGISQYELGDIKAAAETFSMYLRSSDGGPWEEESTRMRALCLARGGDYASAVKIITALSVRHPERAEYELLARRWRALRDAGSSGKTPGED